MRGINYPPSDLSQQRKKKLVILAFILVIFYLFFLRDSAMDEPTIALVLPAYNEPDVGLALAHIKEGILGFPGYTFVLLVFDDGSTDDTGTLMEKAVNQLGLRVLCKEVVLIRNEENLGLDGTLKKGFKMAVNRNDVEWILKTDLDGDFDQRVVMQALIPKRKKTDIIIGQRVYPADIDLAIVNPYEHTRLTDSLEVLKDEFSLSDFDPSSVGSQFFHKDLLSALISTTEVINHQKRWGLDILLPLLALDGAKKGKGYGGGVEMVNLEGNYEVNRRSHEKVKLAYDNIIEVIGVVTKKNPKDLSKQYGV